MLKAAREAAKKEKKESSSPLPEPKKKGHAANKAKLRKKPVVWQPSYAHPWPDEIPDLGPRRIGPFEPCVGCGRGSWARYGRSVLCCLCAIAKLSGEPEWP